MSYEFGRLSSFDFECLVRDLLQAELKIRIEHFTQGRDQGIDLRHAPARDNGFIVQCKHYAASGYGALKSKLKTKELASLQRLNPRRLILATSVGLTPANKEELLGLLTPYVLAPADILGATEINALLSKHSAVEQAHYKLWLTSAAVLDRLLHSEVYTQNEHLWPSLEHTAKVYVQNESYLEALKLLESEHVCIVAGPPGVGKTTLAQALLLAYQHNGYEVVAISEDITEGNAVWLPSKKQIFYYDDFLGQTAIEEKLGKNEESRLLMFMQAVKKKTGKRFILTTREYILEQSRQLYERLARANLATWKVTIRIENYTRMHRARIFYNHLYFSGLSSSTRGAILADSGYRRIIDHPNYNPRVVADLVRVAVERRIHDGDFLDMALRILESPDELWRHAFEHQISQNSRWLLLVMGTLPPEVLLEAAETAFSEVAEKILGGATATGFKQGLHPLDGDFVRTDKTSLGVALAFANPSVRDFVRTEIQGSTVHIRHLFETAHFFEQAELIWSYWKSGSGSSSDLSSEGYQALKRTVGRPPCGLQHFSDSTPSFRLVRRDSLEDRLIRIVRLTESRFINDGWLAEQVRELPGYWRRGEIAPSAGQLLRLAGQVRSLPIDELVAALRDSLLSAELEQLSYARLWAQLRHAFPRVVTDDHHELAIELATGYIAAAIDDLELIDISSELETGIDELEEYAGLFDWQLEDQFVGIEDARKRLDSLKAREEEAADHYADQQMDEYRFERADARSEEAQIDSLFASLTEEE